MNLREQYKEKFGKYPSSQMKEETLIKKLGIEEEIIEVKEPLIYKEPITEVKPKEVMKLKTRTVKGYVEPKEGDTVVRMTSRRRAYLLREKNGRVNQLNG